MLRAVEHHPAASWPADSAADSLTLDYDNRHRRRISLTTDNGARVLLDLPKAVAMAHGDGLLLEDGRWLAVRAAPEALVEIRVASTTHLARIAWHIGNRHCPAQIIDGAIRIRPDHVMEAMILGQGGMLTQLEAPFQPEGGAYGGGAQGHSHGHSERPARSHDHAAQHHHDHHLHGGHGDHHHPHPHDH